ncbi:MAG: pyridoxine 5'-phosphate synthase [bacterium]|nr:pyridoxine 5'-phosphate synthase [bacterium]
MARLSVNVNKIATLRNARGQNMPNLLKVTQDIVAFGAQGITVHPRPDSRHIKVQDVYDIAASIPVELNIEGYPTKFFIDLVNDVGPAQVTLVPDPPDVITSNAGWQINKNKQFLQDVISQIKNEKTRVSLFIDPVDYKNNDLKEIVAVGADAIELYTESYAKMFFTNQRDKVIATYFDVACKAQALGLQVNAGHDLNLDNLKDFVSKIDCITEVSIGHALICDALYMGLEKTVHDYLLACR